MDTKDLKFTRVDKDTQVMDRAGFLHSISFAESDAAPTAGSIDIYDSLTASGTKLYSETFTTTAFRGYTVILDAVFSTGLYVDFTTTADVAVSLSYK
jgi:hypothetical protein